MGKYYTFEYEYGELPFSRNNFVKAIKRLGIINPNKIKKTSLHGMAINDSVSLSSQQKFNRGILNIRKELNTHLGTSGKYTNRMIKFSSWYKIIEKNDEYVKIKTKIPKKEFKNIVETTYKLLQENDLDYCKKLQDIEAKDYIPTKGIIKKNIYRIIAPLQTDALIRTAQSEFKKAYKHAYDFTDYVCK